MSSGPIITVEALSKKYVLGRNDSASRYRTLREEITGALTMPFRRTHREAAARAEADSGEFWALRDVSFEIMRGDVVGIIGRNGAGKSTLLKILSRITEPTAGRVALKGRVASLLEVGTGFHPELTGRENIFLNGAVLGMRRHEIKAKFDEIVAFAEVERFLDTPVKRYSSGMYVRLAFAVAAHLEPEILIVDEVLAVGDSEFQKKCLGKMQDVSSKEGRTVIFVSHNMGVVRSICQRGLLMNQGTVAADTSADAAVDSYLQNASSSAGEVRWSVDDPSAGDRNFRFHRATVLNSRGEPTTNIGVDDSFTIEVSYEILQPIRNVRIGFMLQRNDGTLMCGSNDLGVWNEGAERGKGNYISRCSFPAYVLNVGEYQLLFGSDIPSGKVFALTHYCLAFRVENTVEHVGHPNPLPGVTRPKLDWEIRRTDDR
ncbi:MAG: ABC transporter ATP-binding protein [Rhodospirillales bacterium]|nr:ABC transporter ATP-binding protein [Acetobacter sp.]